MTGYITGPIGYVVAAIVIGLVIAAMVAFALIPIRMGRRKGRRLWPWFLICIPFPYTYPIVWIAAFIMARGRPKGQPLEPINWDGRAST
jgi:hypothetical protein